jgi:hypothetical protein
MKALAQVKIEILRLLTGLLNRVYEKPDGQRLLFDRVPYLKEVHSKIFTDEVDNHANPYWLEVYAAGREDIINNGNVTFITGRFRSGSTLLWNIMRDIPDTTSYYEPFNERQWFNPDKRGEHIDITHLGVDEYWREYDGLSSLGRFFKESWCDGHLYMTASSCEPDMMHYIDELIRSGKNRVILQFNRLDFRLGWIRQHYPMAKIIHIYRHPREQWLSYIKKAERCGPEDNFSAIGNKDFFYLRRWGRDLRYIFPFLEEDRLRHLYELFYLIWRLSYNHGLTYADYSVSMEDLSSKTEACLSEIFSLAAIDNKHISPGLSKVKNTQAQKWQSYAEDTWFNEMEGRCEAILNEHYSCRVTQND